MKCRTGPRTGSPFSVLFSVRGVRASCGKAFAFTDADRYFVIDDSSDWDLEEGSVDFWLWLPASLTDNVGVISRDVHNREQAGHFSLFVDENGRAVARLQPIDDGLGDNSADAVVCSDAVVPRERWFHIGVNFGPPEVLLFVAGELVNATADTSLDEEWTCGFAHRGAIAPLDRRRRSLRFRT